MTKVSCIRVDIYRSDYNCSLNLYETNDTVYFPCPTGHIEVDADDFDLLDVRTEFVAGKEITRAFPPARLIEGKNNMFGGTYIASSDSRFSPQYPIMLMDRVENW